MNIKELLPQLKPGKIITFEYPNDDGHFEMRRGKIMYAKIANNGNAIVNVHKLGFNDIDPDNYTFKIYRSYDIELMQNLRIN